MQLRLQAKPRASQEYRLSLVQPVAVQPAPDHLPLSVHLGWYCCHLLKHSLLLHLLQHLLHLQQPLNLHPDQNAGAQLQAVEPELPDEAVDKTG